MTKYRLAKSIGMPARRLERELKKIVPLSKQAA